MEIITTVNILGTITVYKPWCNMKKLMNDVSLGPEVWNKCRTQSTIAQFLLKVGQLAFEIY